MTLSCCTRRKRGIGSKLVQWVIQHAQEAGCRAIYLHVIDYNHAAMALYSREQFVQVACRDNFYHITYLTTHPHPKTTNSQMEIFWSGPCDSLFCPHDYLKEPQIVIAQAMRQGLHAGEIA